MPERSSALGTWVKRFLMEYLPTERNLAINTLRSYRDGLTLLLPFVAERCRKPVRCCAAGYDAKTRLSLGTRRFSSVLRNIIF
ncbi:MAG: hypothetical protein OXE57_18560 [Alphaproteobacteria bacterium]|nr:hypothetical protein [Alphaproteobacteria bacterium]